MSQAFHRALALHEAGDAAAAMREYRAVVAAGGDRNDQHLAAAYSNLGILLEERARQMEDRDGKAAAELYDECAQLWSFSKGRDHEWTKGAEADVKRMRAVLADSKQRRGKKGRKGKK